MSKVAFVFPGQGSQHVGMGKELHDSFSVARHAFEEADQALGFSLSRMCFEGPESDLRLTENTQPAILTVSIAIQRVVAERGVRPDLVAGHSLGEYSALVCAGALDLGSAVQLVHKRGKFMQEAVPAGAGTMAAILGLPLEQVRSACEQAAELGVVSPANHNASDQVVIAGHKDAVQRACEVARGQGARRVVPLAVSAPFHCALMAPAADRLASALEELSWWDLNIPLVNNVDVKEIQRADSVGDSLVRQVCAPVRWLETVQYLDGAGVQCFIEVGPGNVLSGLIRKILPEARRYSTGGMREIEALASLSMDATM